jgi:hypothetical protein
VPVLNLDTNHISELVRNDSSPGVVAVREILLKHEAQLGLSIFQLAQLGAPQFQHWPDLKKLLRQISCVPLQPRRLIFDDEAAAVVAKAMGFGRRPPHVVARLYSDWADRLSQGEEFPVDRIEMFRDDPSILKPLWDLSSEFVRNGMATKGEAYAIDHPLGPLTLFLRDHLAERRMEYPAYGEGLSADTLATRSNMAAMPAYQVMHELTVYPLRQPDVKIKEGDVADIDIACYAPYLAVSALDKPTAHRVREAKLPCASRVTSRLADVPELLRLVRSGDLVPSAFA